MKTDKANKTELIGQFESAIKAGKYEDAVEAQQELKRMGVKVTFWLRTVGLCWKFEPKK